MLINSTALVKFLTNAFEVMIKNSKKVTFNENIKCVFNIIKSNILK